MIIVKHLAKEVLQTLLAVTLILLFIFSCNEFVRYLGYVASGKYAAWVLIKIVLLQMPILLGLLLPLGLFLGILLGYGRLCVDSEMTALFACGFSEGQLVKATLGFGMVVLIVVGFLSVWVQPQMTLRSNEVLAQAKAGSIMETILPGRFQSLNRGKQVYYIQKLNKSRTKMHNIFMAKELPSKTTEKKWEVMVAQGGHQEVNLKTGNQFIVMTNGHLYKGQPGKDNYSVASFDSYGIRTNVAPLTAAGSAVDTVPTRQLLPLMFSSKEVAAEVQWRLSAPLSVLVLVILALPLSRLKPRQGRFAKMLPAIILYIVYANLIFLARSWTQSGAVPIWLGIWWVHALFLLIGLGLMKFQYGWRLWPFSKKKRVAA